jgi:hypothetical protein
MNDLNEQQEKLRHQRYHAERKERERLKAEIVNGAAQKVCDFAEPTPMNKRPNLAILYFAGNERQEEQKEGSSSTGQHEQYHCKAQRRFQIKIGSLLLLLIPHNLCITF